MTVSLLVFLCICGTLTEALHAEVLLNTESQIRSNGYPAEIHQVVTEDGYILNLFRIPHGLNRIENEVKNESVVLFVHGQFSTPNVYLALGEKTAPAYYFADRGFDVWLFCSRGVECQNPKKHLKWDSKWDAAYWDFSFHEIAVYDLPASIDLIRKKTGQDQIFYVGHNYGTSEFYALMSERPEYNTKIKLVANYGPFLYLKEMDYALVQTLGAALPLIKHIVDTFGIYECLPASITKVLENFIRHRCEQPQHLLFCKSLLWITGLYISPLIQDDVIEVALKDIPRSSMKQFYHFLQHVNQGELRKYDYGLKLNRLKYGQKRPPRYNLTACTVPSAFFYGTRDSYAVREDVRRSQNEIPNTILDREIGPIFIHADYLLARNSTQLLYEPTVKLFRDFDRGIVPSKDNY